MEVSSVHCPGFRAKGPPPTMSLTGANVPRGRNSTVVPTASPHASPNKQPKNRSSTDFSTLTSPVPSTGRTRSSCHRVGEEAGPHSSLTTFSLSRRLYATTPDQNPQDFAGLEVFLPHTPFDGAPLVLWVLSRWMPSTSSNLSPNKPKSGGCNPKWYGSRRMLTSGFPIFTPPVVGS